MSKRKGVKWRTFIFIGFIIYFIYVFIGQQSTIYSMEERMETIQEKTEEEQRLNKELKNQKEIINSDEYIEQVAREKLGMVKKGEKIFVDINK